MTSGFIPDANQFTLVMDLLKNKSPYNQRIEGTVGTYAGVIPVIIGHNQLYVVKN
ncbi:hypothetical protein IV54_GL001735 [Levilactobacillus paucivorans]|uniref:Uncharacterized protein n=1 Tax=Levilactobacillus paucivorans TaxID=616990 RepID=A0A0R2LUZ1_9LACO|nr:hypothetical protein [Levilactobacillus paucivorans]KRO05471.1 hypothetical protein IV54_GL001735 [Levilactobacillus paucivorans]